MTFPLALRFMGGIVHTGGRASVARSSHLRWSAARSFSRSRDFRATFRFLARLLTPGRDFSESRPVARPRDCAATRDLHHRGMETFAPLPEGQIEVPEGIPDPSKALAQVFLLGPIRIFRGGRRLEGGWRRKSLELLAYLAVHRDGVAKDQILEALWPETDPAASQRYFWQSASYLRCRLRGEAVDRQILWQTDDLYRLDRATVWIDANEFENALALCTCASDRERLLRFACDIYKGEFCEGNYYHWSTLIAENFRKKFASVASVLTRLLAERGGLESSLRLLDRGIEIDPYNEDLCRLSIELAAANGRIDLGVRRFRRLRRMLLLDLGVEPSMRTMAVFERLGLASGPETETEVCGRE